MSFAPSLALDEVGRTPHSVSVAHRDLHGRDGGCDAGQLLAEIRKRNQRNVNRVTVRLRHFFRLGETDFLGFGQEHDLLRSKVPDPVDQGTEHFRGDLGTNTCVDFLVDEGEILEVAGIGEHREIGPPDDGGGKQVLEGFAAEREMVHDPVLLGIGDQDQAGLALVAPGLDPVDLEKAFLHGLGDGAEVPVR